MTADERAAGGATWGSPGKWSRCSGQGQGIGRGGLCGNASGLSPTGSVCRCMRLKRVEGQRYLGGRVVDARAVALGTGPTDRLDLIAFHMTGAADGTAQSARAPFVCNPTLSHRRLMVRLSRLAAFWAQGAGSLLTSQLSCATPDREVCAACAWARQLQHQHWAAAAAAAAAGLEGDCRCSMVSQASFRGLHIRPYATLLEGSGQRWGGGRMRRRAPVADGGDG